MSGHLNTSDSSIIMAINTPFIVLHPRLFLGANKMKVASEYFMGLRRKAGLSFCRASITYERVSEEEVQAWNNESVHVCVIYGGQQGSCTMQLPNAPLEKAAASMETMQIHKEKKVKQDEKRLLWYKQKKTLLPRHEMIYHEMAC